MLNDEILQLKSYDEQTGREISNVFPITNLEAVKVDNDTNLKEKLTEIGKQIEQTNNSLDEIDKKVDNYIENNNGVADNDKVDYMGKQHDTLKATNDSNIEYMLRKTNIQKYEGSSIVANNTYAKQVNNVILKGVTKYKDLHTGEFVENFSDDMNLELVGSKAEKLIIENHIDAINKGLITIKSYGPGDNVTKIDNANFTINTSGHRYTGVSSTGFFTANIGGPEFGTYIIEFDGKLISGDISSAFGVYLEQWSTFANGYNGKLPVDGKYRAVVKSNTNTVNSRSTQFRIFTTNASSVNNRVEYKIENLRVYCVTDANARYQSSELILPIEHVLYSIGDIYDYIDLNTGVFVKNIGMRAYKTGDETNNAVMTDKKNTIYKLETPVISKIDLQGQKVYSYDGTTYYTCKSGSNNLAPILSMEVPTNLAMLVQLLVDENKAQDELLSTTMLATDEMYMMIEPLLAETLNETSIGKMVSMYVAMVQRGIKNVDEVPVRYREQVKAMLDK